MTTTDQYFNGNRVYFKNSDVSTYVAGKQIIKLEGYDQNGATVSLSLEEHFGYVGWAEDVNASILYWASDNALYNLKLTDKDSIPTSALTAGIIPTYFDKVGGSAQLTPAQLAQVGSSITLVKDITSLTLTGNNLVLTYDTNSATGLTKTVSLSVLAVDIQIASVAYNTTTKTLDITESNGDVNSVSLVDLFQVDTKVTSGAITVETTDVSATAEISLGLSDGAFVSFDATSLLQIADQSTILGTGAFTDPFRTVPVPIDILTIDTNDGTNQQIVTDAISLKGLNALDSETGTYIDTPASGSIRIQDEQRRFEMVSNFVTDPTVEGTNCVYILKDAVDTVELTDIEKYLQLLLTPNTKERLTEVTFVNLNSGTDVRIRTGVDYIGLDGIQDYVLKFGESVTLLPSFDSTVTNNRIWYVKSSEKQAYIPPAENDFFRAITGATLPDGSVDTSERIRRDGFVGLNIDPTSTSHVNGSLGKLVTYTSNSATLNLNETHYTIELGNGSNGKLINLPNASTCKDREYIFYFAGDSSGANTVTIASLGGLIGSITGITGTVSFLVMNRLKLAMLTVRSDGTNWHTVDTRYSNQYYTTNQAVRNIDRPVTTFTAGGGTNITGQQPNNYSAYQVPAIENYRVLDGNYTNNITTPTSSTPSGFWSVWADNAAGFNTIVNPHSSNDLPYAITVLSGQSRSLHFKWNKDLLFWEWIKGIEYKHETVAVALTNGLNPNVNTGTLNTVQSKNIASIALETTFGGSAGSESDSIYNFIFTTPLASNNYILLPFAGHNSGAFTSNIRVRSAILDRRIDGFRLGVSDDEGAGVNNNVIIGAEVRQLVPNAIT